MRYLLSVTALICLIVSSCGRSDWQYYNLEFLEEQHDDYVMEYLDVSFLNQMEDSINLTTLFAEVYSPDQIQDLITNKKVYFHTFYGYGPVSFSMLVTGNRVCENEMYMFTVEERKILDFKKVGYTACLENGREILDFRRNVFDDIDIRYFKQLDHQLIPEQYIEKCKITAQKFECTKYLLTSSVALRDTAYFKRRPERELGWWQQVPLGTKIYSTGVTQTDTTQNKPYEYLQVFLENGKTGWMQKKYIVEQAIPAAVIDETPLFKTANAKRSFDALQIFDIVAISEKDSTNNRYLVTAKTFNNRKTKEGWISGDHFSFSEVDVEFCRLVSGTDQIEVLNKELTSPKYVTANDKLKKAVGLSAIQ